MNLLIKGKNMEVPESAKEYVTKRVSKFDRHLSDIGDLKVELSEESTRSKENHYVVEMTLDCKGTYLRGEERGANIFNAVDEAAEMMDRQILRYKDRLQGRRKRSYSTREVPIEESEEEVEMVRFKRFPVKPMGLDEAVEQMELLGHDFFIFFNDANEKMNVLYRRNDGKYGVLDPEMD